MAAEINNSRKTGSPQLTVNEVLAEFRGLSGTGKRRDISEAADASRLSLEALFNRGDGAIGRLLEEMKAASRPVRANDLGIIGEAHLIWVSDEPELGRYRKVEIEADGVPYLIEVAFGYRPPDDNHRIMIAALNWSASVGGNPFKRLGAGDGLGAILAEQCAGPTEPIGFVLHLATPRPSFLDKGKTIVKLPWQVEDAILDAVRRVTAQWRKHREKEKRDASAQLRRMDVMTAAAKPISVGKAAAIAMTAAYAKASDGDKLWAEAHQIHYAARPDILRLAQVDSVDPQTFAQTWLVNYMTEHPDECATWKVAFADRGRLVEPHTGLTVGLGTRAVEAYLRGYARPELLEGRFTGPTIVTHGPLGRYGGILYIEKAGFGELF
jgi:hypothetical protein